MICEKCGTENKDTDLYCKQCGASLIKIETASDVAKKADEIELELPKNIDVEMSKVEDSLDDEEDLQSVLTASTTTGTQTSGNVQAQTVVHQDLSNEKKDEGPSLVMPATKTEELIAQKQKEKAERDARIAANDAKEDAKFKEEISAKPAQQLYAEPQEITNEDKIFSAISYLTPIAWIIIFVFTSGKRSQFVTDKLNESLVLHLAATIFTVLVFTVFLLPVVTVFWIWGLVRTLMGNDKPLPLFGNIKILK